MAGKKPLCKKEENKIEIVELSEHASVRAYRVGVFFLHFRSALDSLIAYLVSRVEFNETSACGSVCSARGFKVSHVTNRV